MEVDEELSAAGVLELAWTTGLVTLGNDRRPRLVRRRDPASWSPEAEIAERYHDTVVERCGIRTYVDDGAMVDNTAPLLTSVFLDNDLTFMVASEAEAQRLRDGGPEHTVIAPGRRATGGDPQGRHRDPRAAQEKLTRTVGGQIPTGFDPTAWGIPARDGRARSTGSRCGTWSARSTRSSPAGSPRPS